MHLLVQFLRCGLMLTQMVFPELGKNGSYEIIAGLYLLYELTPELVFEFTEQASSLKTPDMERYSLLSTVLLYRYFFFFLLISALMYLH